MSGQAVEGRQQIAEVLAARHALTLAPRAGVAAQVERQAGEAEPLQPARLANVLALAATPPVHEHHAGGRPRRLGRTEQTAADSLAIDGDDDVHHAARRAIDVMSV